MEEKKEYRSAKRSRKMIREAFIELVEEKKNGKVTVTDIVKRADINRSTFYAHYQDVQGVAEEMEEEIIQSTLPLMDVKYVNLYENPKPFLKNLIKIMEENEELYRAIEKSSYADHFEKRMAEILTDFLLNSEEVPDMIRKSPFFDMGIAFIVGGIVNVCHKWFQGNLDYDLEALVDEMEKMIVNASGSRLDLGWGISVDIPKNGE